MLFLTADFIFDGTQFLPENSVLQVDPNGSIAGIVVKTPGMVCDHYRGMLMPGMVNAHCHLELSHMKNLVPVHTGLINFLLHILKNRNDFAQAEIMKAIARAEDEMLANGIVAVGDISNGNDTLPQKSLGRLHYHTFVECFGLLEENALQRFEPAKQLCETFNALHPSSVVLHAPYSISNALISLVNEDSAGKITSIHNQECHAENELFRKGTGDFLKLFDFILPDIHFFMPSGKSSLQTYLPKLMNQEKIILVHNTCSTQEDLDLALSTGKEIYWCLCPNANVYIEQILPDIALLMNNGCRLVLGTDSLASNHELSLFSEIKTLQTHFPDIPLKEMLHWATLQGAQALGMAHMIGSFEKGKRPGIIHVENMESKDHLPQTPKIKVVVSSL